jgi:glycosyltransferase involved in cell wall biosynthesis
MQISSNLKHPQYKICHLTSVHPYKDTRIYLKECSTLFNAGYETHFIAPDAPNEVRAGIHLHSIPKIEDNRFKRMTQAVLSVYQQAIEINADIYHFHDPELIPIGLLLKAKGKKVIYDIHEDLPRDILTKDWIPKYLRKIISIFAEKIENNAAKNLDAMVSATPHINRRFINLNKNSMELNNYPILTELYPSSDDFTKQKNAFCYVGGIGKIRGIFEIIEAIDRAKVKLLLAGSFNNMEEKSIAINMEGWQYVEDLGHVDRQGVLEILQKSMAGLVLFQPIPNHLDSQPNKMFEYMSAGIPVIASDFPLWREIVEGNKCGICVNPQDSQAIATALQWILEHPVEAKEMGENGRKAIEKKYNWEQESKALINLYSQLASEIK